MHLKTLRVIPSYNDAAAFLCYERSAGGFIGGVFIILDFFFIKRWLVIQIIFATKTRFIAFVRPLPAHVEAGGRTQRRKSFVV